MFDDLNLLIVIISLFWLGAFGFYLYTSRQQETIADEVEQLQKKLDKNDGQE
ncbi:MAG: hypothetical protein H6652_12240 [Ardenticatenaceae bacterium]|nr:hypothetical protein [Ardenticatenaceae bacterium]MCB8947479.1 hypothetical protein [Ardenticatenaceae bacterium]